ncbi:MAG: DUF3616 domain-containing protein [Neisseria sp.]|nr:DUF3616 domain-containing protein [Neisseria sp.]
MIPPHTPPTGLPPNPPDNPQADETDALPEAETGLITEAEAASENEPVSTTEPASGTEAAVTPDSDTETVSEPDAEANSETAPVAETGSETEPDAEADSASSDNDAAALAKSKKKKSAAKKRNNKPAKKAAFSKSAAANPEDLVLGSPKGVETMFRNAFRAELELIALAATKANIMISLNGFIVSALMISGAFIFASSPAFLVPAGIFLFTAAASIVFALISASPERAGLPLALWEWLKDVARRRARLRDFKQRVIHTEQGFVEADQPNILIYEDRAQLSKPEYWTLMQNVMTDRNDVYHKMSDQLYWLGMIANKKFKYLNMSYTVFRWGLLASVIAFIGVKSVQNIVPVLADTGQTIKLRSLGIHDFDNIYEPSAVQQLADGRLLVVEDESSRAFSLMKFAEDGTLYEDEALDVRLIRGFRRKLSDLEGLAKDNQGYIYATTSHSRNKKGERRPDREHMIRFKIEGNDVRDVRYFSGLTDALDNDPGLRKLIRSKIDADVDFEKINIEGLLYDRKQNRLLLGFREPMVNELSMIIVIDNPKALFEEKAKPRFSDAIFLNLSGGGIRALSYDPVLDTYMIVNEIVGYEGNTYSQLWTWNGNPNSEPEPVALPDIINLNNVESIDSVTIDGESRLMIMSDEGNEKKNRPAKYMMLDYDQLQSKQ